jgi:DNA-binding CsgD family transcriptional regulator
VALCRIRRSNSRGAAIPRKTRVASLSGKQLQCLELVGEGYTSAEIESSRPTAAPIMSR